MTSSACTVERRSGISTSTPRRASRYARSPTSATPAGSSARGGTLAHEPLPHALDDLLDARVAREARRLAVAAAAEQAGDRGDVDLVDARTERDAAGRLFVRRGLPDEH